MSMHISVDFVDVKQLIITNENKTDPLRAVNILKRKVMGHTAVSATEASSVTLNLATWSQRELL